MTSGLATMSVTSRPSGTPVVLLVEDNGADADLVREGLVDTVRVGGLYVVADGIEALRFLRRETPFTDAPRPDLILLDLNMPRLDGRGVLSAVKQDSMLRDIPVIVLSSSDAPGDVAAAYRLQANCYVQKPVSLGDYLATLSAIERFWLGVAALPMRDDR